MQPAAVERGGSRLGIAEVAGVTAGPRIRISPGSSAGASTRTSAAPFVTPGSVKIAEASESCLEWLEMGRFAFELTAARSCLVSLEWVLDAELRLEVSFRDDASDEARSDRFSLEPRGLDEPTALVFDDSAWRQLDGATVPPERGLLLWWQGERGLAESTDIDADLQRRLEAIGYVQ